nr:ABC transporter ATP-binding protein [Alcaligenaceae bacterium]
AENLVLLGASGCGKSTLLKAIAGLEPMSGGSITLDGKTLADQNTFLNPSERGVGMIFQDYALFPHLNCRENILFGLHHLSREEKEHRLQETLSRFELKDLENRYPHQLSGGQQQRVAIARSLICKPKLLLFDEPFSNLDTRIKQYLMLDIRSLLKKEHMTAIFVTHDKEEAFIMGNKIAMLDQGRIVQCDQPKTIYDHPNDLNTAKFFGMMMAFKVLKQHEAYIETEIGLIPKAHRIIQESADGTIVYLRPHEIQLKKTTPCSQKKCQIIESRFNGDHNTYHIQLKHQTLWIKSQTRFQTGDWVQLMSCVV